MASPTGGRWVFSITAQPVVLGINNGIAPVFPQLAADPNINYLHNPLNQPTPTLQMMGSVPYRVDLTPFAGQLSAAGRHLVSASGALLVYLDPNRTLVTGGVTMNTLYQHTARRSKIVSFILQCANQQRDQNVIPI